jgi:hypothetical protein
VGAAPTGEEVLVILAFLFVLSVALVIASCLAMATSADQEDSDGSSTDSSLWPPPT